MRNQMAWLGTITVGLAVLMSGVIAQTNADTLTLPHTFQNGEVADANQVNANFQAVKSAVDANAAHIAAAIGTHQLVSVSIPIVGPAPNQPPIELPLYAAPSAGQFVVRYVCSDSDNLRIMVKDAEGIEYVLPVTSVASAQSSPTCKSIDPGYVLPVGSQLVCVAYPSTRGRCWVTGQLTN